MSLTTNRRNFLQASAAAGIGYWVAGGVAAQESTSPNEQIQLGCIGVNGKGASDIKNVSEFGAIYALCDVDSKFLEGASKRYKTEHNFSDFREMLDKMGDRIDAVTVSIPDHCHAAAAAKAMKMGKHVYCQKPLTHTIWEARRLGEIAKEKGVATQMGNQYTALNSMRKAAAKIRAGQLGTVKELHVWTNRPIWPQGESRPATKPTPENVNWEAWIGPAPLRPYARRISSVRVARLVGLRHRRAGRHGLPHLQFAKHGAQLARPGIGRGRDRRPQPRQLSEVVEDQVRIPEVQGSGSVHDALVRRRQAAAEGAIREGHAQDQGARGWQGNRSAAAVQERHPHDRRQGDAVRGRRLCRAGHPAHRRAGGRGSGVSAAAWAMKRNGSCAMRDKSKPAMSNFADVAGPLTETILLGNLAVWKRGRVEWDPVNLKPLNDPALAKIVRS